jgi:hypothetical protein
MIDARLNNLDLQISEAIIAVLLNIQSSGMLGRAES